MYIEFKNQVMHETLVIKNMCSVNICIEASLALLNLFALWMALISSCYNGAWHYSPCVLQFYNMYSLVGHCLATKVFIGKLGVWVITGLMKRGHGSTK